MSYCPDNYDMWKSHDQRQTDWLNSRPQCVECNEHIQDEKAYYINGEFVCKNCMRNYLVDVEDYCE